MKEGNLPTPSRVVRGMRPLLFAGSRLFCARHHRIYSTDDYGATFQFEGRLELNWKHRLLGVSRISRRVFRQQVYRMRCLSDNTRIYVYPTGVYRQAPNETVARKTFQVTRGTRPVSLATGADDLVVFGEYFSNAARDSVHIYGSRDRGVTWDSLYEFPAGSVRHVHGVSYDPWENCYWICTGDVANENQVLRANHDWSDVQLIRQGGQANRFYYLLVRRDKIITATDTPTEDNYITSIDKQTGQSRQMRKIQNTNFYSCSVGRYSFVSVNAEPSDHNDSSAVHLWMSDEQGTRWRQVGAQATDAFDRLTYIPRMKKGLFQYPRIFFPEGENPGSSLVSYMTGVRGYDEAMLCYELEQFAEGGHDVPAKAA